MSELQPRFFFNFDFGLISRVMSVSAAERQGYSGSGLFGGRRAFGGVTSRVTTDAASHGFFRKVWANGIGCLGSRARRGPMGGIAADNRQWSLTSVEKLSSNSRHFACLRSR